MTDPIRRLRDRLLAMKKSETSSRKRVEIAEALADLDEIERQQAAEPFQVWCAAHAPRWNPSKREEAIIKAFLVVGDLSRDDIANLIGTDEPASREAVRAAIHRLNSRLHLADARAAVREATRDGIYRTHEPTKQTLR